jgi:hypothetical protein
MNKLLLFLLLPVLVSARPQNPLGAYNSPATTGAIGTAATNNPLKVNNLSINLNPWLVQVDQAPTGPNPWIDFRNFGAISTVPGVVPWIPGITVNCTNGSPNVIISSASTFTNGAGVAAYGCGPLTANAPAAPTVTPILAASQTETLKTVASPSGSTTYCYQILARTFMGGTAVSPETCTATGQASLGIQTVNITSASLSNNVATFTTSSPHGLVAGAMVIITGVSTLEFQSSGANAGPPFNGWFVVDSTADNTHFVVNTTSDTRDGAISTGTGGSVSYHNGVKIVAAESTNNYEYYIYGRVTGGTKTLIGQMTPQNHSFVGKTFYLEWDDFGTTVSTFPLPPTYIPTTVPVGSTNDMLATTIVSGAGTTSLVLSANASNTINGQTILQDDAQPFLNAAVAASTAGTAGTVMIPATGNGGLYWVFNSPIALPNFTNTVVQNGQIWVNEPIKGGTTTMSWSGGDTPSNAVSPGFSQQVQTLIVCNRSSPCIHALYNFELSGVSLTQNAANGANIFLQDSGGIPTSKWSNVSVASFSGGVSYSDLPVIFRGASADLQFTNVTLAGSQNGSLVGFTSTTPGMFFNQVANAKFDYFYESGVGVAFYPNEQGAGQYINAKEVYCQACYMPNFSITSSGQTFYGTIENVIYDTFFSGNGGLIGNYGGSSIEFSLSSGAGGIGSITGGGHGGGNQDTNVFSTESCPLGCFTRGGQTALALRNSSFVTDDAIFGRGRIAMDYINRSEGLGQGYSFFTTTGAAAAPVCTVSAGGSIASGTYYAMYSPIYSGNGSAGANSQLCSFTITPGNQTVTISVPAAVAGGNGNYDWTVSTSSIQTGSMCGAFPSPLVLNSSSLCSVGLGGGPIAASGGPAGMQNIKAWAVDWSMGLPLVAPTGFSNSVHLYMDPVSLWPFFKPNGDTSYLIPGISGAIINGHVPCASGTGGVYIDCTSIVATTVTAPSFVSGGGAAGCGAISGCMSFGSNTFSNLGTPGNGILVYCSDCVIANPCAGSGTGAFAKRLNGIWVCN